MSGNGDGGSDDPPDKLHVAWGASRATPRAIEDATQNFKATPAARLTPAADGTPEQSSGIHYSLGGEVARGGLGRVSIGYDHKLQREVAIKELIANDPDADRRFLREARLTARLQHPAIVPVHDTDQWPDGKPFYTMKLLRGRSLMQLLDERPALRDRLLLLPTVLAVAEAVAYAHDKRIIHRDLKPSNVVVGAFGETAVVDWGLAKELDEKQPSAEAGPYRSTTPEGTLAGSIVGTPAYMPPEQADGQPVDARADVYALGALLYHVLAGAAPYSDGSPAQVLERLRAAPPASLETRVDGVPVDLGAIVRQAMHRDPAQRYADGSAFAADLRRFLNGQLVLAQRYSRLMRLARFVSRHRTPALLSAGFTLLVVALVIVGFVRIVHERDRAQARSNELILAGARATLDRDPTATLTWLKQYPLTATGWDEARDLALEAVGLGTARSVLWPAEFVSYSAYSPDGKQYVNQSHDKGLEIRDVQSGAIVRRLPLTQLAWILDWSQDGRRVLARLREPRGLVMWDLASNETRLFDGNGHDNVVLAPDGSWVATGTRDGRVELWGWDRSHRQLGTVDGGVVELIALQQGRQLAAIDEAGALYLWTLASESAPRQLRLPPKLDGAAASRDGRYIVGFGARVTVLDVQTGQQVTMPDIGIPTSDAQFSPDATLLAVVGQDPKLRIWDWRKGGMRELAGHERDINRVAFAPDGFRVATASRDATARVWDLRSGRSLPLRGHGSQLVSIRFDATGQTLLTTSADMSNRIWTLPEPPLVSLRVNRGQSAGLRIVDESHVAVVGFEDNLLQLVDLAANSVQTLADLGTDVTAPKSSDGQQVVVGSAHSIVMWNRADGRVTRLPIGAMSVQPSCDGRSLIVVDPVDGRVSIVGSDGQRQRVLDKGLVGGVAFYSPDCRFAFTVADNFDIHRWELASGARQVLHGSDGNAFFHGFVSGGRLVTGSRHGDVRLWDSSTGGGRLLWRHPSRMESFAVSADGRWLATGDRTGQLRVFDSVSGGQRTFVGHSGVVSALAFSPDGKWLLSGAGDRTARLWDVASGAALAILATGDTLTDLAFFADGARAVGCDNTGQLRVWRLTPRAPATHDPRQLRDWLRQTTTAELLPDRRLASEPND